MSVENRGRVLRAATSSFLSRGYRTSVDDIARRARLAKQTVYHHFGSKDALFKEVARELAKQVLIELEPAPGEDLRACLVRFGLAYRSRVLGVQGLATFRTVVPEVTRFPALARAMYEGSAGEMIRRVAELLSRCELEIEDAEFAAEMLLGMLAGQDRLKRLFAVPASAESEARRVGRIVDCFLRAHQK